MHIYFRPYCQGFIGLAVLVLLFPWVSFLEAAPPQRSFVPTTVERIIQNPEEYVDQEVELADPVLVTKIVSETQEAGMTEYIVQGGNGGTLPVLTTGNPPEVGSRYVVQGRIQENKSSEAYSVLIYEIQRDPSNRYLLYTILGLLVIVVGLGIYVIIQRTKGGATRETVASDPSKEFRSPNKTGSESVDSSPARRQRGSASPGDTPESESKNLGDEQETIAGTKPESTNVEETGITETETVKYQRPTKETVKMLGRLEIITGHDEPEIPLMKSTPDQSPSASMHVYTIGRAPAPPGKRDSHIQLKPRTVSRKQAKLSIEDSTFRLTNLVSHQKNPTMVNGSLLEIGDQIELDDGDIITMGEVKLRLHVGM